MTFDRTTKSSGSRTAFVTVYAESEGQADELAGRRLSMSAQTG